MAYIVRNIDGSRSLDGSDPFRTIVQAYGNNFIVQGDVYTETPVLGIPGLPPVDAPVTFSFQNEYRGKMGFAWQQSLLNKFGEMYGNLIQSKDQWDYLYNTVMAIKPKITFSGFEAFNGTYEKSTPDPIYFLNGDDSSEFRIAYNIGVDAWVLYYNFDDNIAYICLNDINDPNQVWESYDYDVLDGVGVPVQDVSQDAIDFNTQFGYFAYFRGSSFGFRVKSDELWQQKLRISGIGTANIRPPPYSYLIGVFSRNALYSIQGAYLPLIEVNNPVIFSPFINKLSFSGGEFGDGIYIRSYDDGVDSTFINPETNNYVFYDSAMGGWALVWADESEQVYHSYGDINDPLSLINWEADAGYEIGTVEAQYWSQTETSSNPWIPAN